MLHATRPTGPHPSRLRRRQGPDRRSPHLDFDQTGPAHCACVARCPHAGRCRTVPPRRRILRQREPGTCKRAQDPGWLAHPVSTGPNCACVRSSRRSAAPTRLWRRTFGVSRPRRARSSSPTSRPSPIGLTAAYVGRPGGPASTPLGAVPPDRRPHRSGRDPAVPHLHGHRCGVRVGGTLTSSPSFRWARMSDQTVCQNAIERCPASGSPCRLAARKAPISVLAHEHEEQAFHSSQPAGTPDRRLVRMRVHVEEP